MSVNINNKIDKMTDDDLSTTITALNHSVHGNDLYPDSDITTSEWHMILVSEYERRNLAPKWYLL